MMKMPKKAFFQAKRISKAVCFLFQIMHSKSGEKSQKMKVEYRSDPVGDLKASPKNKVCEVIMSKTPSNPSSLGSTQPCTANVILSNLTTQAALNGITGSTTLTVTDAVLTSIQVSPANPTLSLSSTLPFTATGTYSDSNTKNLTNSAVWTSSSPSTATISNAVGTQGVATGLEQGNTTIFATLGSIAGSTSLFVQGPLITSIIDNFGPKAGGKTSTLTGAGLLNATAVNFGLTPAASFKVNDDTSITVVSPPGALSTVQISVCVGASISSASSNPYYAYQGNWIGYVTNENSNNLTPIDLSTNTLQANIPVGELPVDIAITPNGLTAYVCANVSNQVIPVSLITHTPGDPISIPSPLAISITPDGTLAYVTSLFRSYVTVIDLTKNLVITTISIPGAFPLETGITPDGTTAFVTNISNPNLTPINTTTQAKETLVDVGGDSSGIAITPDGTTAYICLTSTDSVGVLVLATRELSTEIPLTGDVSAALTITPNGTTAYVATQEKLTPIALPANTPQSPITFPSYVSEFSVTPDNLTGYATLSYDDKVIPVTLANATLGTPIHVASAPYAMGITPDPAPIAVFTTTVASAGFPTNFDASRSVSSVGTIKSYAWNFGDSQTLTTTTPTVNHTYVAAGTYSVTLTVTNSAGTSTTQVFTGQMVSRNGGPSATMTQTISVTS